MATIRIILIASILGMAGCSTVPAERQAYSPVRPSCPDGTMMICRVDSARGCACGELIVLN